MRIRDKSREGGKRRRLFLRKWRQSRAVGWVNHTLPKIYAEWTLFGSGMARWEGEAQTRSENLMPK
jgi:hypothetical protein